MFDREHDMAPIVDQWMRGCGLLVRSEFVTPWGICDLVGIEPSVRRTALRINLGQKRPITNLRHAAILLEVPDVESGRKISTSRIEKSLGNSLRDDPIAIDIEQLCSWGYLLRDKRGQLQKRNGWMPIYERLVAVELKLSKIDEALRQAKHNRGFATHSFVALPSVTVMKLRKSNAWSRFEETGVGILAVSRDGCWIELEPLLDDSQAVSTVQLCCAEKFWREIASTTCS